MKQHLTRLKNITEILLEDERDFLRLSGAIKDYRDLLLEISELNLESEPNRKDLIFENGVAIGTTWAARCLDDILRTRQFVRGIHRAVKDLLELKRRPISIMYAGSGPFATLILPILSQFSEEEVQVEILEVNPHSFSSVQHTISTLGFEGYISGMHCVDATKFRIDSEKKVDILLSETMQRALIKEQQVPIMLNLVPQLDKDITIIPENIRLDVGFWNSSTNEYRISEKAKKIAFLINFGRESLQHYLAKEKENRVSLIEKKVSIPTLNETPHDQLAVLTEIYIYKDIKLGYQDSSLTYPLILKNLPSTLDEGFEAHIQYKLEALPRFECELI